jgi:hypothetical protein
VASTETALAIGPSVLHFPPDSLCKSSCSRGIVQLFFQEHGSCASAPQIVLHCDPYTCADSAHCTQVCQSDSDCEQGFVCEHTAGQCVPDAFTCLDESHLVGPNDQIVSCPLACAHGQCF